MSSSQQYCTTRTAATRLGVSRARVRQLAVAGHLAGRRDGNGWELHPTAAAVYRFIIRFEREHVGEWIGEVEGGDAARP